MKLSWPLFTRFAAISGLAIWAVASQAVSQVLPFALAARYNIDLGTNEVMIDSFDSQDPNYSTGGLYDPAKRKARGCVACTDGLINVRNAEVRGSLFTGPNGSYSVGSQGTVGDLFWPLAGSLQPGHYKNDLNIVFADVLPPYTAGLPPIGATIGGTNYTWVLGNANYMDINPGGVTFHTGETVLVVGRARLYVMGDFIMQGGSSIIISLGSRLELYVGGTNTLLSTINNMGNCGTFMYFGLASNQALALSGNDTFWGCIYAPSADLTLSGGGTNALDFQGACTVMSVSMNGRCNFHYDERLGRLTAFPWNVLQPPSQVVTVGQTVTLAPLIIGALPLSYQWRLNGTNIPAATNATYTIIHAQPSDAGAYSQVLTNYFGSATSSNAVLVVNIPPTMAVRPWAGCPELELRGMLSSNFVVQYSTNLAGTNWMNLLSLTNLPSSPYLFVDPAGDSELARFYRAFMQ